MKDRFRTISPLSEKEAPQPSIWLDVDGVFCLSEKSFQLSDKGRCFVWLNNREAKQNAKFFDQN